MTARSYLHALYTIVWQGLFAALVLVPGSQAVEINEEVKRFDFEVEWRTLKAVEDILTPSAYARQLKFEFPVQPPQRRPEEVNALIRAEVERVVEEKHPQARLDEIDQEAQRLFRLYKVGDQVTIRARLRGTEYEEMTGVLRMITVEHIKLGDTLISHEDLAAKDLAHFDRFLREDAIKAYVSTNKRRYREMRDTFESEQRMLITKALYEENGYRQAKGQWWPAKAIFDRLYMKEVAKLMAEKRPEIRRQVLEMNGIVVDEAGNPVAPAGTGTEPVVVQKTKLEQAVPSLKEIVRALYGGGKPEEETPPVKPLTEEGSGLFDDLKAPAPDGAKTAPAPAPAPADVTDLYDERDE